MQRIGHFDLGVVEHSAFFIINLHYGGRVVSLVYIEFNINKIKENQTLIMDAAIKA